MRSKKEEAKFPDISSWAQDIQMSEKSMKFTFQGERFRIFKQEQQYDIGVYIENGITPNITVCEETASDGEFVRLVCSICLQLEWTKTVRIRDVMSKSVTKHGRFLLENPVFGDVRLGMWYAENDSEMVEVCVDVMRNGLFYELSEMLLYSLDTPFEDMYLLLNTYAMHEM